MRKMICLENTSLRFRDLTDYSSPDVGSSVGNHSHGAVDPGLLMSGSKLCKKPFYNVIWLRITTWWLQSRCGESWWEMLKWGITLQKNSVRSPGASNKITQIHECKSVASSTEVFNDSLLQVTTSWPFEAPLGTVECVTNAEEFPCRKMVPREKLVTQK